MSVSSADTTSRMLCGGMLVAMPTAMPADPFTIRLGTPDGRTVGSSSRSSKLGANATVFLSMSASISTATRVRRASVYRYAAPGAEVPLPVHQRIAQREVLHHAHQRVVHRLVAVRVVLAQHIADNRR